MKDPRILVDSIFQYEELTGGQELLRVLFDKVQPAGRKNKHTGRKSKHPGRKSEPTRKENEPTVVKKNLQEKLDQGKTHL